jgi:hypothetical protein
VSRYSDVILSRNPVAYWPLDDVGANGGSSAVDATGHGYTGHANAPHGGTFGVGSVPFPSSGPSVRMTSTTGDDWLDFAATLSGWPNAALPHHSAPFTYEYWKRNVDPGGEGGLLLVSSAGAELTALNGPYFGNQLEMVAQEASGWAFANCATPVDWMQWQYVVGMWTGSAWAFYINCASQPITGQSGTVSGTFTATKARLGYGLHYQFEVAHAALYDRALTVEEITAACLAARRDVIRLTHAAPPKVCWETDGAFFRVYSDDALVFETPIEVVGALPAQLLGKDPPTGLPRWTGASDVVTPLIRTVLPNDTDNAPLPDDTVVTTVPTVVPTPVPAPVVDNCPQLRCGAAHLLGKKLREQYDLIRGILLGMLAAPILLRRPNVKYPGSGPLGNVLLKELLFLLNEMGAPEWAKRACFEILKLVLEGLSFIDGSWEAIGDTGEQTLTRHAYEALTCSENVFKLTQEMVNNWAALINADTYNFTEWQRHLLVYCIQFTPFYTYSVTAENGARSPLDNCDGWTSP